MAESESTVSNPNPKPDPSSAESLSFSIWPPSSRTRDAVVQRLIETLTSDTVLSKRYGTVPAEEAQRSAQAIETAAFEAAQAECDGKSGSVEVGIEILQVYSKEVSKRMLETAKARAEVAGAAAPAVTEIGSDE